MTMRSFLFLLLFLSAAGGYWLGKKPLSNKQTLQFASPIHPLKNTPLTEYKSFVFIVYACNQAPWCEKSLRSIFEQEYDHYRVVIIDDASSDETFERMRKFIVDNQQEQRAILVQNEKRLGAVASLYRAIDGCLDREIAIPLEAKDWMAHPFVLRRLNFAYQNPDVWLTFGQAVEYPSYAIVEPPLFTSQESRYAPGILQAPSSFYAGLMKQIGLGDLFKEGRFAKRKEAYLSPVFQMAAGRFLSLPEPIAFYNGAACPERGDAPFEISSFEALSAFPPASKKAKPQTALLLFSSDRPLSLFACLESLEERSRGCERTTVVYAASDSRFAEAYERVKTAFPQVHFADLKEARTKKGKTDLLSRMDGIASPYIAVGDDALAFKDFVDLSHCAAWAEKTGAEGFYFDAEPPESQGTAFADGLSVRDLKMGASQGLALVSKERLKQILANLPAEPSKGFSAILQKYLPQSGIALSFEEPKALRLPEISGEEQLAKLHQDLKIDLEPLQKAESGEPQSAARIDFIPL